MKKKLLVFTLCFTLIFSSLNYKKSYADGGVISLPMLATISALAVGSNIIINNSDDLYDLGKMFYDYIDNHNSLTWATVQSLFASCVALQPNNLVSVKSDFLDIVKSFFDVTFSDPGTIGMKGILPISPPGKTFTINEDMKVIDIGINAYSYGVKKIYIHIYQKPNTSIYYIGHSYDGEVIRSESSWYGSGGLVNLYLDYKNGSYSVRDSISGMGTQIYPHSFDFAYEFPYAGGYTWDDVDDRINENNELPLPIPGNLDSLVGQVGTDFWDNTDNLVGNGNLSLPSVGNPSIGVDDSVTTFPLVDSPGVDSPSVPNEGIWATIKEFIIGLVVPSDAFWTDTWGGLYNNFTNSFPLVDMDNFNKLVTGEKKFPNIDVNIMGVNGRIVNGDVINSIVDWLRPIVAGFMMLCLMLFNYRKIYKLIRNSEPFGSVASGNNSDIRTGISEYSKHEVVKATDMVAEYHAWRERGGK